MSKVSRYNLEPYLARLRIHTVHLDWERRAWSLTFRMTNTWIRFNALLGDDGAKEVRFERVAAG